MLHTSLVRKKVDFVSTCHIGIIRAHTYLGLRFYFIHFVKVRLLLIICFHDIGNLKAKVTKPLTKQPSGTCLIWPRHFDQLCKTLLLMLINHNKPFNLLGRFILYHKMIQNSLLLVSFGVTRVVKILPIWGFYSKDFLNFYCCTWLTI